MKTESEDGKQDGMSMQGRVPKLRFPEFRDAAEWREETLINIADRITQRNSHSIEKRVLTNSATDGIVDQREYFEKDIANQDNLENYFVVNHGDYVYNPRISVTAPVGPISKNKLWKGVMSPLYTVFRFRNAEDGFFEHFFKTNLWHKYLMGASNTGARHDRMAISNEDFMRMPFPFPKEQQKIADCLSSLDGLLAAHTIKLATLKTYKKGLMQQLFPSEGASVPKLRFPEFRDAPEWSARELGEFIIERNQYPTKAVPLFSLTIEDGITPKTARYERSFLVNSEEDAYKLVLPNDFAYNPMNLRFGAIGKYSGKENVAVSKYYNTFFCDKTVNSKFCEMYFKSDRLIAFYDTKATGSLVEKRRVHFNAFLKFNLRFPSLPEQQKIADCLSSIDTLITAQAQKIAALKLHKKGLMQQLFPAADEVII